MHSLRTFSERHIERCRLRHRNLDGYGRHRHLYLHQRMRELAQSVQKAVPGRGVTLLDYGCGKGRFIDEMRGLRLFSQISGYDPGFAAFQRRPVGVFDIVTCLDVLDTVEARFVDAVLDDIARLTGARALFDCLTRPDPTRFPPHPPFYWRALVERRLPIVATRVEYPGMDRFERVIITAEPCRQRGSPVAE
jgi:2-polyprenyl-3-methyl-5-hydroxy-6-metoxy-1,4-benzoquinol methylase